MQSRIPETCPVRDMFLVHLHLCRLRGSYWGEAEEDFVAAALNTR